MSHSSCNSDFNISHSDRPNFHTHRNLSNNNKTLNAHSNHNNTSNISAKNKPSHRTRNNRQSQYFPTFAHENSQVSTQFPPDLSTYPSDQYHSKQVGLITSFRAEPFFDPTKPLPSHTILPHISSSEIHVNRPYRRILMNYCDPVKYRANGGNPPKLNSFLRDYTVTSIDLMRFYNAYYSTPNLKTLNEPTLLDTIKMNNTALFDGFYSQSHHPNHVSFHEESLSLSDDCDLGNSIIHIPRDISQDIPTGTNPIDPPLTPPPTLNYSTRPQLMRQMKKIIDYIHDLKSSLIILRENAPPQPLVVPYWEFLPIEAVLQLHIAKVFTLALYGDHLIQQHTALASIYYDQSVPWSANNVKQKLISDFQIKKLDQLVVIMEERLSALLTIQSSGTFTQDLSTDETPSPSNNDDNLATNNISSNSNTSSTATLDMIPISASFVPETPLNPTPQSTWTPSTPNAVKMIPNSDPFMYQGMYSCGFTQYPLSVLFGNTAEPLSNLQENNIHNKEILYDSKAELNVYLEKYSPYTHKYIISSKNMLHNCNEKDKASMKCYLDKLGVDYDPLTEIILFKNSDNDNTMNDSKMSTTDVTNLIPDFLQRETFVEYTPPYWYIVFWRKFEQYLYKLLMCYKYLAKNRLIKQCCVHPEVAKILKVHDIRSHRVEQLIMFFYKSVFLEYITSRRTPTFAGGGDIALDYGEEVCGENIELQYELLIHLHRQKKLYEIHYFYTRFTDPILYPQTAMTILNQVDLQRALPLYFAQRDDLVPSGSPLDQAPPYISIKTLKNPRLLDEHHSWERCAHTRGITHTNQYYQMNKDQVVYVSNDYILCDMFVYLYNIIQVRCLDTPKIVQNTHADFDSESLIMSDFKVAYGKLKNYAINVCNDSTTSPAHITNLLNSTFASNFINNDVSNNNNYINNNDLMTLFQPSVHDDTKTMNMTNNSNYSGKYNIPSFDEYFLHKNVAPSSSSSSSPSSSSSSSLQLPFLSTQQYPPDSPVTLISSLSNHGSLTVPANTKEFSAYITSTVYTPQYAPATPQSHTLLTYFTHTYLLESYSEYLQQYGLICEAPPPPPTKPTPETQHHSMHNTAAWSIPNLTDFMVCGFDAEFSSLSFPSLPLNPNHNRSAALIQYHIADYTFLLPFWLINTNTDNIDSLAPQYVNDARYTGLWLSYIDRVYIVALITKILFYSSKFIIAGISVDDDVKLTCDSFNRIVNKYIIPQIAYQLAQRLQMTSNTGLNMTDLICDISSLLTIDQNVSDECLITQSEIINNPLSIQKSIFFSTLIEDLSHLNKTALKPQLSRFFKLNYDNVSSMLDLNNVLTYWGTLLLSQYQTYQKEMQKTEDDNNLNITSSSVKQGSNSNDPLALLQMRLFPLYTVGQIKDAMTPMKVKGSFSLAKWVEMSWPSLSLFKGPVTCSNWSRFPLYHEQIIYASLDAYISLQLLAQNYQTCVVQNALHTPFTARNLLLGALFPAIKNKK